MESPKIQNRLSKFAVDSPIHENPAKEELFSVFRSTNSILSKKHNKNNLTYISENPRKSKKSSFLCKRNTIVNKNQLNLN